MKRIRWIVYTFLCRLCTCSIETFTADEDNRKSAILSSYAFASNGLGVVNLEVKNFVWTGSRKALKFGFLLHHAALESDKDDPENCLMDLVDGDTKYLWTVKGESLEELGKNRFGWSGEPRIFKAQVSKGGYYYLYESDCSKGPGTVSYQMKIDQHNIDNDGVEYYLPDGLEFSPSMYWLASCVFLVSGVYWYCMALENPEHIKGIHHLMGLVVLVKVLDLTSLGLMNHFENTTGLRDNGWNVVYYIFQFIKGVMLFSVLVLIGTGWSYMRSFLTARDKKIIMAVLVLQAMVNVAWIVVEEKSHGMKGWVAWRDVFHVLDMICCCATIFPIVWSINALKESAGVDGRAQANLARLEQFRRFYLSVVAYIYFTRIGVLLLGETLPYKWLWIKILSNMLADWIFYAYIGYLFLPRESSVYFSVESEDWDDLDEEALDKIENFELHTLPSEQESGGS